MLAWAAAFLFDGLMHCSAYEALVIGGGPGGSTAAAFLARASKRVLLLEKHTFPRFHIGESLLPYNRQLFLELGVLSKLEAAGFVRKHGAQFHLGNGSTFVQFVFRQGRFTREKEALQVERSRFDQILLEHARSCGAEIREGWTVTKFKTNATTATIEARDPEGQMHTFGGQFLIDASGRSNLTGNQEGIRVIHPHLRKLAIFGHFTHVRLDDGETAGDTIIVRLANKWFWLIPLSAEKVSVGCVLDQEEFVRGKEQPETIFARLWQSSPPLSARMKDARLIGSLLTTSDFSYYNRRFTGERLLRVGDAAGFMDPIFSSGVYLAMFSARLAAQTVVQSLGANSASRRRLRLYEKQVYRAMKFYWHMVEQFYTTPFMELFMAPREKFHLASAVNAVLAGELEGGWPMHWRMRLFFWIVRLQARWPLAPRIHFD